MNARASTRDRPIEVVMFGSGPRLTRDAQRFLCRLEAHPEIQLVGAICQANSQSLRAVIADLWRRRGVLAAPLLLVWMADRVRRLVIRSEGDVQLRDQMVQVSGRLSFVPDIHAPEVLEQLRELRPDLGLIYGSPILKPDLFEIPRYGTLGIHHGKVPDYRGNKTMFWAMYNQEKDVGVTIQKINAGLDTGAIVLEGEVPIEGRSMRAVWHDLEELGLNLYIEAIIQVKEGRARFRPQEGGSGKLYRNPKPLDFIRFWGRNVRRRLRRF